MKLQAKIGVAVGCGFTALILWQARGIEIHNRNLSALERANTEAKSKFLDLRKRLPELTSEHNRLADKQNVRTLYAQALRANSSAVESNSDDADIAAIARFQAVMDRFPDDPLAQSAKEQIERIRKKMAAHALAIKRAQAPIIELLKICDSASTAMRQLDDKYSLFKGNRIDWQSMNAEAEEERPYQREFDDAQRKAQELLTSAPDPDGSLAKRVAICSVDITSY